MCDVIVIINDTNFMLMDYKIEPIDFNELEIHKESKPIEKEEPFYRKLNRLSQFKKSRKHGQSH